jgi:hypothetical protein
MNDQAQETREEERWRRAPKLPPDVFAVLHKPNRAINPIAVVATVDPDGTPHTAPFGSLRAVTPRLLRLACNRYHDTYANICRDGRVMVAWLAPPNIAVSIRGQARVVKEQMNTGEHLAVLEVDVEEVKNDMMRRGAIESEIQFAPPKDLVHYYVEAIAEIEDM